jgi:hypothetical protein
MFPSTAPRLVEAERRSVKTAQILSRAPNQTPTTQLGGQGTDLQTNELDVQTSARIGATCGGVTG